MPTSDGQPIQYHHTALIVGERLGHGLLKQEFAKISQLRSKTTKTILKTCLIHKTGVIYKSLKNELTKKVDCNNGCKIKYKPRIGSMHCDKTDATRALAKGSKI